jgi:hypothetical protein
VTYGLDGRRGPRQWLAHGTAQACTWRFGIGQRVFKLGQEFLEVVLEIVDDGGGGGVNGYPLNKLSDVGISWGGISGPFSQDFNDGCNDRLLDGATKKGTTAVEVEMDDGTKRSAIVVPCDAAPFDLFVVVLAPQDRPIALVRYEKGDLAAERVPLSIPRPSYWPV